MKRIIELSMAAAENPSWDTVQARIKWLMADKSKDYDDLVASRQRIYRQPGFVGAMRDIMALQDPRYAPETCWGQTNTAPSLRRHWCCGPVTIPRPTCRRAAGSRR